MPINLKIHSTYLGLSFCLASLMLSTACSQSEIVTTLGAISTLVQSKSLVEQFVRDEKGANDPNDASYREVMTAYEDARDAYNRYLTSVEIAAGTGKAPANVEQQANQAKSVVTHFLALAARSLKPDVDVRAIDFDRAVSLPADLPAKLTQLPAKYRSQLISQYDKQLRWQPWGHL